MTEDILFDNIYVGHSEEDAKAFAAETFDVKKPLEESANAKPAADDDEDTLPVLTEAGASSARSKGKGKTKKAIDEPESVLPPAFTPSINKTLNMVPKTAVPPLPQGLTVAQLKTRLEKKTKIK